MSDLNGRYQVGVSGSKEPSIYDFSLRLREEASGCGLILIHIEMRLLEAGWEFVALKYNHGHILYRQTLKIKDTHWARD
jgi:hypothetical protein